MTWPKSLREPLRSWRPLRGPKVDTSQNQRRTSRVLSTLLLYAALVLATSPGNVRASIRQTTAGNLGANAAAASVAPLFRTVRLDGGKLHGLTKSDEAGSGQVPVDVNVRVKKGQFRWYDRLTTADQMYASGEYARAFHIYDDVIAMPRFPVKHRPAVLLSAARTLAAQHRDLEARRLLEAAFEDKPSLATTEALRFTAGLLATRAADWTNARRLYLQVIAQNPHHMDALNHLAMLELIVGNLDAFQTRFLHFIRIQSAIAENRQHRLFQNINHSYKSSFRKDRLGQEMTAWLTDHVMLSFSLDGAPSRLAAAALAGNADLEGYLPGSIEANCVLVYTAYTRTLISGTRFDAQGAELNRGLLHFNLAQRLRRVGALKEAAWHLQFAADLDAKQRRGILLLQAALLQARASSAFAARNERLAHFSSRLSALEELLQVPESGSSFHCMALSASLDLPVESALTEALKRAALAACDIDLAERDGQLAHVPSMDVGHVRRIGVFSAEFYNSTSGRMLVPLLRAVGLRKARFNADLVLFTWPLLPSRRYLVNPEMLNNIDPFDAGLAAEIIRRQRLDELIVVDAHRDLRVWLLANTRGIAPRVSHWNLASPRGALALMPPKVQTSFLFALFDDLWNWSSPPRPRHQNQIRASIQGQYFFAEELYFLIAGRALAADPDPGLEDFIETLHALHSSTVVIFIGGEADESVARTALWERLAARKIDLSRVRVLRRLSRDVFLTFVEQNVDVVVESPRPQDGALFVILEALRLNVPIVACEGECKGDDDGESESAPLKHDDDTDHEGCSSWAAPLLRGFGVDSLSLAKNPKDLARLAFRLTGSISAERNAFVQSLQARPQTDDPDETCVINGFESTVSALL